MRAPATAAGSRQACPQCGGKVLVPKPDVAGSAFPEPGSGVADSDSLIPASAISQLASPFAESIAANVSENDIDNVVADEESLADELSVRQLPQRRKHLVWIVPLLFVGILVAVIAWLLYKPEPKLEGALTAQRLTEVELGPFRLDNSYLGRPKRAAQEIFSSLESEPLRASSPSLILEFNGGAGGISISITAANATEFVRVDPQQNPRLARYLKQQSDRFKKARDSELVRAVPEFLKAIEKRSEGERDISGLAEFRNSVGLASLVRGFGFHVQALVGKQAYRCVHEDAQGRLYFALPIETSEFEIIGRPQATAVSKNDMQFTGRFTVKIAKKPVTEKEEAPDMKKKIRKLLDE